MLEAQPLHRVVELDVDAEVVGIELELVVAEPAGLVDVHDQVGDVAVILDAPVPVARGVGLIVDQSCLITPHSPSDGCRPPRLSHTAGVCTILHTNITLPGDPQPGR